MTGEKKEMFMGCIPKGRKKAVNAEEIGRRAGMDPRHSKSLRNAIFRLMMSGERICIAHDGDFLYYIPESGEVCKDAYSQIHEIEMKKRHELRKIKEIRKQLSGMMSVRCAADGDFTK